MKFELAYYDVIIQYISHNKFGTPLRKEVMKSLSLDSGDQKKKKKIGWTLFGLVL